MHRTNLGQTTIEYVLLMSVLVIVMMGTYRLFLKDFLASDSSLVDQISRQFEYAYRFPLLSGEQSQLNYNSNAAHPGYYSSRNADTRFFTGIERYPQ